jgi:prolipoprotein diacylglyceryl transferase
VRLMPLLALPFPAIDPVALAIGPITIKWYALAYIAGLIGGWYYARRLVMADRLWGVVRRPQVVDIDDLVVWVALGVVLGGRIGYVLFYNLPMYLADPIEILAIRNGGMSFHGGFLGAILAFLLFARAKKLNGYTLLDIGAVVVPIGLFFGRIANFVNGELWGRVAPDCPTRSCFPAAGRCPVIRASSMRRRPKDCCCSSSWQSPCDGSASASPACSAASSSSATPWPGPSASSSASRIASSASCSAIISGRWAAG